MSTVFTDACGLTLSLEHNLKIGWRQTATRPTSALKSQVEEWVSGRNRQSKESKVGRSRQSVRKTVVPSGNN